MKQRFEAQGYTVSIPLNQHRCPYDLVVDVQGRLYRVQVKRARWQPARRRRTGWGDRACYAVTLMRHNKGVGGQRLNRRLLCDEFDYLCVVCEVEVIYVIPVAELLRNPTSLELLGRLEFKPPIDNGRWDSAHAAKRWKPYVNQFALEGV